MWRSRTGKQQYIRNYAGIILKPTERGEIELTDAIQYGIKERNWKFRVIKMARNQFRGDFGDKDIYEQLKTDSTWLKELTS